MDTTDLEKISTDLALLATRRVTTKSADDKHLELIKQMAGMGLGGVGLGALLGAASKKDKLKKMLTYGAAGGLAGAGLGALNQVANVPAEIPPPPSAWNPLNWRWFSGPPGVARA